MVEQFWLGFEEGIWIDKIDVRNFIQRNYTPYNSDECFLKGPTTRTKQCLEKFEALNKLEREQGVIDIDTETVSSLLTFRPGYLDKNLDIIKGLQTDAPLKRAVNPFGGIRMARSACKAYGYELGETIEGEFKYKTTHNDGVFRVYSDEMRMARRAAIITGLPDAYGRGRIIGDYRRVALYGVDRLIKEKQKDKQTLSNRSMSEENIRLSEELYKQIDFLCKLKEMALTYNEDIGKPAKNAREAVQWTYFAYLAAVKEQNGAAMSLGRVSTFLDIYIERDINNHLLNESEAQELIDDFVLKLRMVRQLRTPEYNELFAGDPNWITESIGGIGIDGRSLVTKTSFRILQTLYNLNPSPEPNLTILWSNNLPGKFKEFCAKVSMDTHALQFENDDLMRERYGDDYGIACCVSAMKIGQQMQFFGARCNLPKLLLLALNGGKEEIHDYCMGPQLPCYEGEFLEYDLVMKRLLIYIEWLAELYVNTMNVIHYMHDKYAYEKIQMALHDTEVERFMAFGIAGLSVVADSLSAIKHGKIKVVKDAQGKIIDFDNIGDYPKFGNGLDEVDCIAKDLTEIFIKALRQHQTYRHAEHTLSLLTITSNVVYGKKTGNTPDGRKAGEPFAPGANPMHGRETKGALASLNSMASLDYDDCRDGISCTFSLVPELLGKNPETQKSNLVHILDGYFNQKAFHLNVNVISRETLLNAQQSPEKFPNLTIRVSGYAVKFNQLNKEQQDEVIKRSYFSTLG